MDQDDDNMLHGGLQERLYLMYASAYLHTLKNIAQPLTSTTDMKIMEAAIELVGELGYKGTTTRQIAERARVDEVTLFRRFGSKEALTKRAVSLAQAQIANNLLDAGREKTGNLKLDLTKMALLMMQSLERRRELVVAIMFEAKREAFFSSATSSTISFILNLVKEFLENYDAKKPLKKDEIEFTTQSITSFVFYRVIVKERLLDKKFTARNRKEEFEGIVNFLLRNVPERTPVTR